ncbi:hypothetical protein [Bacillus safensis]|uniref:hypothetical protein n=1 Tax=Bacillus safensis TaxID=561879 RepID=UPI002E210C79|nr:hypothetical protein [Bacillus safensis]
MINKMMKLKKICEGYLNSFVEKELCIYREKYTIKNKKAPNETEEKGFKRNLVARLGVLAYLLLATVGFLFLNALKGIF